MDKDYFCPVVPHELPALLADRIRHNNHRAIPPDRTNQRQTDALIPAGRLYNDRILLYQAALLRLQYHIVSCSCFNGASHIQPLKFHQHFRAVRVCIHAV